MKIEFSLTQEEADALKERVNLYNAGSGEPAITAEQFLAEIHCKPFVRNLAEQRYHASLARLGAMFKAKTYEERLATIVQLEQQGQTP